MAQIKKTKKAKKGVTSDKEGELVRRSALVTEKRWFTNMDNFLVKIEDEIGLIVVVCLDCEKAVYVNTADKDIISTDRIVIRHSCPKKDLSKMYKPITF